MQVAAHSLGIRTPLRTSVARLIHVPRLVTARSVAEDAPLSAADKERLDKIADALVAKLQELPDDAGAEVLDDGEPPRPPVLRATHTCSAPVLARGANGLRQVSGLHAQQSALSGLLLFGM